MSVQAPQQHGHSRRKLNKQKKEAPAIEFDPQSRHKFIYGFRKRKQARRKQGMMEALERERQDKIQVKKDYRDDVKRKVKELQWATKQIDRYLCDASGKARALALEAAEDPDGQVFLGDGQAEEDVRFLEDGNGSDEELAPHQEVQKVVHFAREATGDGDGDDDPFGDCEVTTTNLAATGLGQSMALVAAEDAWAQNGSRKPLLTLALGSETATALQGMAQKAAAQGLDMEEFKQKRKVTMLAEEKRRWKAMERKVRKLERLKKIRNPKKTPKRRDRIKAQRSGGGRKSGGGKKGGKRRNKRL